jgi:hypothetical protein
MSTSWYFECLDHEPPIVSDMEFTQHTDDEHFQRALKLVEARPLAEEPGVCPSDDPGRIASFEYFDRNARQFLRQHPHCSLGLLNEYGDRRPVEAAS